VIARRRDESGPAVVYSYVRFSSKKQAKGDSLRRQEEMTEAYCERRGWRLSEDTYEDLGVSAWKGKNALAGNLGEFLKAVRSGAVKPGSALIVESLDRLTRQGVDEGYDLIKSILKADIRIVTLAPEREFDREATKGLGKGLIEILLILERAAEENERRSQRVRETWDKKKQKAREGNGQPARREGEYSGRTLKALTTMLPAWVRLNAAGDMELDEGKAATVRLIFDLAASGYGARRLLAKLKKDKVPPIGAAWGLSYVGRVLRDRRAIGEYQPARQKAEGKGREKDGKAIEGFYPAVVTPEQFRRARAGADQRGKYRGRTGGQIINPFSGLLRDARGGGKYYLGQKVEQYPGRKETYAVLQNSNGPCVALSYPVFERALLSALREVDPAKVAGATAGADQDGDAAGRGADPGGKHKDDVATLEGELKEVCDHIGKWRAELLRGDVRTIAEALRELEARERELEARLEAARVAALCKADESWKKAHSLIDMLDGAADPDDVRLRLRSELRRVVESVWLLVIARGRDRVAAVQVRFHGGGQREYLLWHRPPRGNQHGRVPGWWRVTSMRSPFGLTHPESPVGIGPAPFDLASPAGVERTELELAVDDEGIDWLFQNAPRHELR
jgi:DNA invertase Pin-like site-specific DNA recombinase